MPTIRYCATPAGRVAYSTVGHGPPLLLESGWVTGRPAANLDRQLANRGPGIRPAWDTCEVVVFRLSGDVSSENLTAIRPVLTQVVAGHVTDAGDGLHVEGVMEGNDARDVNRRLLSALRRLERRTRLRAEWTADGVTYRFFDYALKSQRPA